MLVLKPDTQEILRLAAWRCFSSQSIEVAIGRSQRGSNRNDNIIILAVAFAIRVAVVETGLEQLGSSNARAEEEV